MEDKPSPSSTNRTSSTWLMRFISRICQIPPQHRVMEPFSSPNNRVSSLKVLIRILFPKYELLKYELTKTAVELTRLENEVKGYISELESDFRQGIESQTFEYVQMEPQNRFVTEVLRQKKLFLEKYYRCYELFNHGEQVRYTRERDETIKYGRDLLKEIGVTYNKLPLSTGSMGL